VDNYKGKHGKRSPYVGDNGGEGRIK